MFEKGDILRFIDNKHIKILVKKTINSVSVDFVDFIYLEGDSSVGSGVKYSTCIKYLEYDPIYYRGKKIKNLIFNI